MTLDEAAGRFRDGNDFILTSHESPDADGLGAEYALAVALSATGKKIRAVNADDYPPKYAFIDERGIIEVLGAAKLEDSDLSGTTVVLIDTNDIQYTGDMADIVLSRAGSIILFDHHEAMGVTREEACSVPDASSTCEMVHYVLKKLGIPIAKDVARALFAGIVYDTGSFSYAKTSASTLAAALDLVRKGANPSMIHNLLYESSATSVLLLRKEVLSTLELHHEDQIAIQVMNKETLMSTGASYEDAEDLINVPLQGKSIEVSVFFKMNYSGILRCSLRSKGSVNVAHVAQSFGGGGHKTAAGFKSPYPLDTIKKKVLELIGSILPN
ncbi:MAG: bifunctional oligoribonuclease/PAP phosphatase NrnA [Spirochaetales bacterium]|nr:MAG: bifunctional oligoribonuclease/PAP phosphatase NrnA [Spirochaetales bacterium]